MSCWYSPVPAVAHFFYFFNSMSRHFFSLCQKYLSEIFSSIFVTSDIAVIYWDDPMLINDYVNPISIPAQQDNEWLKSGTPVRVCGWGDIQEQC